jgi:hypothetical protein
VTTGRRTASALAAATLAMLVLAGCGQQAGAASIVGGQTVTDRQVADVVDELKTQDASITGATFDQSAATAAAVTMLTRHLILDEVAKKEGLTPTPGQVDAFIDDTVKTQFSGNRKQLDDSLASQSSVPASQVGAAARDQVIYNALLAKIAPGVTDQDAQAKAMSDYLAKEVAALGVDVSPRFGTWNVFALGPVPQDLSILPSASPSASSSGTGAGAGASPSPSAS